VAAKDAVLDGLLTLIQEGVVERRCAALLVLGALQRQDDRVVETAGQALSQANPVLKDYALRYFEDARPKTGLAIVSSLLDDPDKDLQERAIRLLASFGQMAIRPTMQGVFSGSRSRQINSARVLLAIRSEAAWKALFQILAQGDVECNRTVCDLLIPPLRELEDKEHDAFYEECAVFAESLDEQTQRPAVISAIRILGQMGRAPARQWLFRFVSAEHHPSLRFHAIVALLHCLREQKLQRSEFNKLLPILEEKDYSDTVRLTMELLDAHQLPEDAQPLLSRLVDSSHIPVQKFALRKLGEFESPTVVKTLLQQLGDADAARRDAAARALQKIPAARTALAKEFLSCEDARKAWAIAEILPTYEGRWRKDQLEGVWDRLNEAIAAEEDRLRDAFLHVLKNADADYTYQQLAARGAQLMKSKKYREAVRFLSLLRDFTNVAPEDRFRFAVAQFKVHTHTLGPNAHRQDPTLDSFSILYRSSTFPLLESLKKEKTLEPDDLFYLGFCFTERAGEERTLGEGLLEFLVEKYPRTKVGKSAKNKLKLLAG
jgi:HEAT repeat protein